jgi:hypothetical protein
MTTCKDCCYWLTKLPEPSTTGQCRRHAPRPFLEAVLLTIPSDRTVYYDWADVRWPLTAHDDSCGEGAVWEEGVRV